MKRIKTRISVLGEILEEKEVLRRKIAGDTEYQRIEGGVLSGSISRLHNEIRFLQYVIDDAEEEDWDKTGELEYMSLPEILTELENIDYNLEEELNSTEWPNKEDMRGIETQLFNVIEDLTSQIENKAKQ